MKNTDWLDTIEWNEQGLIPVITQEASTRDVLTLAWINREALAKTVECGEAVYWSRSRQKLWHKGEESGHIQKIVDIRLDCDNDALIYLVESKGLACHIRQAFLLLPAAAKIRQSRMESCRSCIERPIGNL